MKKPDGRLWAEQAALWLYPRRCPFCNVILGRDALAGAVCPACAAEEQRLAHEPPRVPETEHVLYALNGALAAYYYEGMVREAILLCKRGGTSLVCTGTGGPYGGAHLGRRSSFTAGIAPAGCAV